MNALDYVHIDYGIQREKSKVAKNEEKKLHNIQFFSRSIMCTKKIMENTPAKQVTVMEHKLKKWNCMKVPWPFAHQSQFSKSSLFQYFFAFHSPNVQIVIIPGRVQIDNVFSF